MSCIVRRCQRVAIHDHKIIGNSVSSCDKHYDAVWLKFRNAQVDVANILEALHWECRNLGHTEGGEEG